MSTPVNPISTTIVSRRHVLAGMAAAGMIAAVGPRLTFAQEATPATTAAALPAGEATWPRYNLNAVTDEQIVTIPGAGDQMTHEFAEYRPWTTVGQFRAEIGKYVDEDIVTGYERYVFVPVSPNDADADTFRQLPGVDADKADALVAAQPFVEAAAFLASLGGQVSAEQAAAAAAYLAAP